MKLYLSLILSTIVYASGASAQDVDLGGGVKVSQDQLKQISNALPKTVQDRYFYHWTNRATGMRWIKQGYVNSGEVNFYNTPTGDRQVYGPGIYLAEKPTSSKSFGEVPVSFTIDKGTPIYDEKVVEKIIGKVLNHEQASELGEHIPLIRHANEDWFVTNHAENTDIIRYGRKFSPEARTYVSNSANWTQFRLKPDFKELIQNGHQDAIYLKNIIDASDYMDGISFARAMKVNPGAPWNEFEPQNFAGYQRAMDEFSEKLPKLQALGADKIEQTLLEVQTTFSGRKDITDIKQTFRSEGIRAGGDEAGKSFLATTEQLKTMQANSYLEVVSTPQGNNHLVHYFYPDALHYKKLKGKIPDELFNRLGTYDPNQLMNDHGLRNSLNKELISELVKDFSKRYKAGKAEWIDLISIHPFEDMNGRTVRMMQEIFANGENHFILGDIDILQPLAEQKVYWQRSATAHQNFQADLIDEFLMAKTENRMPDYLKTNALKDYVNRAFPTPMKIDLDDHATLELIRNRQWLPLLENGKKDGVKELLRSVADPATKERAILELIAVTKPAQAPLYNAQDSKDLLTTLNHLLEDKNRSNAEKINLLDSYEAFYKKVDKSFSHNMRSPTKIKFAMIDEVKTVFKSSKAGDPKNAMRIFELKNIERDPILSLNHFLSLISDKNDAVAASMLEMAINTEFTVFDDLDQFKAMDPAKQKRVLMATKAYIEKQIEFKNKSQATEALTRYKNLYAKADPKTKLAMPDADKLRSWTRNAGHGKCTLAQLLIKLGP